jgi:hypothetical protein
MLKILLKTLLTLKLKIISRLFLSVFQVAIRVAYNYTVVKLSKNNPRVIALGGETNTSTYSYIFKVSFRTHVTFARE